jgi:hypothetical protein
MSKAAGTSPSGAAIKPSTKKQKQSSGSAAPQAATTATEPAAAASAQANDVAMQDVGAGASASAAGAASGEPPAVDAEELSELEVLRWAGWGTGGSAWATGLL